MFMCLLNKRFDDWLVTVSVGVFPLLRDAFLDVTGQKTATLAASPEFSWYTYILHAYPLPVLS